MSNFNFTFEKYKHVWYPKLYKENHEDPNGLIMKSDLISWPTILICWTPPNERRFFTKLEGPVQLSELYHELPDESKSLYEIILGNMPQKIKFDLDISHDKLCEVSPDKIRQYVVNGIVKYFTDILKKSVRGYENILVYTSHGETKNSYHIILNGFYTTNNVQSKEYCKKICEKIFEDNPSLEQFIDLKVYSSTQQFRILGCKKQKTDRVKIFQENEIYKYPEIPHNEQHKFYMQLCQSLVTNITGCVELETLEITEASPARKHRQIFEDISEETSEGYLQKLREWYEKNNFVYPYQTYKIIGDMICLKRRVPSMCPVCHRVHENEGAFLLAKGNGIFFCRRDETRKIKI